MKIVISSGHGKYIRGASGYIDEVDEARRVVPKVVEHLEDSGITVFEFHDNSSTSQSENLDRIVDFHNSKTRDLDISVHFNAYKTTPKGMGTECLYVTQSALAQKIATAISGASNLIDRGPKKRTDLFFLNETTAPAVLIEVCFVDSREDVELYDDNFDDICRAIAQAVSGITPEEPDEEGNLVTIGDVMIRQMFGGDYVYFISDLDVCNDGSGPSHGDPSYQPQTAYYNGGEYLNADEDRYIVIPPQVRELLKPDKVMGCQARLTCLKSGLWTAAVCGDIGPDDKTGEAAFCAAKVVNPKINHNSGDESLVYLYELWPDKPASVNDKTYSLE